MTYTHEIYEDNAGSLHLAILNDNGTCIYYLADNDRALVLDTLADLKAGSDPITDCWEGGELDPAASYEEITNLVAERNGGAWELETLYDNDER